MSRILQVPLPDDVYARLADKARAESRAPEEVAAELLAEAEAVRKPTARSEAEPGPKGTSIRKFFGALPCSGGSADNRDIDADLVREYAGLGQEEA